MIHPNSQHFSFLSGLQVQHFLPWFDWQKRDSRVQIGAVRNHRNGKRFLHPEDSRGPTLRRYAHFFKFFVLISCFFILIPNCYLSQKSMKRWILAFWMLLIKKCEGYGIVSKLLSPSRHRVQDCQPWMGIWLQKGLPVSVSQQHFPTVVPLQEAEIQEMILLGEAIKMRYHVYY